MRCWVLTFLILALSPCGIAQSASSAVVKPVQFELGLHTFFDFGPPNNYYEIFVVRSEPSGTTIDRVTLTPPGDVCVQPAKVEIASAVVPESVQAILGGTNPCSISDKEVNRELKRCKKCLVFSGANVTMTVKCGNKTRSLRSDILDKDMFDPAPDTPEHTSWTMNLLSKMDKAVGPGVMDRPIFAIADEKTSASIESPEVLRAVGSGAYDELFKGAPDRPSDLFRAAQSPPPTPSIQLEKSEPLQPEVFVPPTYPPIARLAHVEGIVTFTVEVKPDGRPTNFVLETGHPMLRGAVENAVAGWTFPKEAFNRTIEATISFNLNCPKQVR